MKALLTIAFAAASVMWAGAEPKVEWLENVHDFGAFDENDGKVTCRFRFVNTGDEPVAVVAARATCGCTVPEFPRDEIVPGDTASVSVTYDPTGRPGRFEKKVYVDLTTADTPRTTLLITGVVIGTANTLRARYPVDAGALKLRSTVIPFGNITYGRTRSEYFEAYNATADTIRPKWENLPPYITVSSVSPLVPPGEQIAYAIGFMSDKAGEYGIVQDSIYLRPRPDDELQKIDLVATVNEDFSKLTPGQRMKAPVAELPETSVDFGSFDGSTPLDGTFSIGNKGKSELKVRRVYTTDPGVEVLSAPESVKAGAKASVTIRVYPAQLQSELLNARIMMITNDPDNPEQSVRVVGLPQ